MQKTQDLVPVANTMPAQSDHATHWYFMELEKESGRRFNAWGSLDLTRDCTMPEAFQFAYRCALEMNPEARGSIVTDFKLSPYMVHPQGLWARLTSWLKPRPAGAPAPRPSLLWGVHLDGELVTLRPVYADARRELLTSYASLKGFERQEVEDNFDPDLANGDWVMTRLDNRLRDPGFYLRQIPVVWAEGEPQ